MRDLTEGPIPRHILSIAIPIGIGMLFQTLYVLVDLYFVGQLGDAAIAGVSAGSSVQFIVTALTQILGVGTMALIAQASGRKDREDANVVFNQSLRLAATCALGVLIGGYTLAGSYMATLGADAATAAAGTTYLHWFLPGLALQFAISSMGSALQGTGIAKPTMVVQMIAVTLNAVLSPMLIAGWWTGRPLGVLGAGLSTSISIAVGALLMLLYFLRLERYVQFQPGHAKPRLAVWRRILKIGLPPGGEFLLLFLYIGTVYWIIRAFGSEAQAGFGIGSRVMQAIFLPAMAVAFATAPVVGQNFGGGHPDRVRQTLRSSALIGSSIMFLLSLFCQWRPDLLVGFFTDEAAVIAVGAEYLQIISWNFVAVGLIFTFSGVFQGIGNTLPPLLASGTRLLTFVLPGLWLASRPGFELRQLWILSVATVALQVVISGLLLRATLRRRSPLETGATARA
jgi:putative MATE family efflux protein